MKNNNNNSEIVNNNIHCLIPEVDEPNISEMQRRVSSLYDYSIFILSNYHSFHEEIAWSVYGEVEQLNRELSGLIQTLNTLSKKLQKGDTC